jgi:hypothetical protein
MTAGYAAENVHQPYTNSFWLTSQLMPSQGPRRQGPGNGRMVFSVLKFEKNASGPAV